jgi:selenocysteine lyase/cysteine desulfurase
VTERWRPYKARPAPGSPLGRRFETGTLPYEMLAGFKRLGYDDKSVRIGFIHYNTAAEVDRLLEALEGARRG